MLLFLVAAAALCLRAPAAGDPGPALAALVRDLLQEGPWYYRPVQRWPSLQRLLPQAWLRKMEARHDDLSQVLRRDSAIHKLAAMGTNAWPAVPALARALRRGDVSVALAAAEGLAVIKADEHPDWARVEQRLNGQSTAARAFDYLLVGRDQFGRRYDPTRRRFALVGLAATGPAAGRAGSDVIDLLKSKEEAHELRALAPAALARIDAGKQQAVPLLKAVLRDAEEWPDVRAAAALALVSASPADPETRALLRQGLQDERALVRLGAARGLWRLGVPAEEVLPTLGALLSHKLITVRTSALHAVAEMGHAGLPLRAEVVRLTADDNESVRRLALGCLLRFPRESKAAPGWPGN